MKTQELAMGYGVGEVVVVVVVRADVEERARSYAISHAHDQPTQEYLARWYGRGWNGDPQVPAMRDDELADACEEAYQAGDLDHHAWAARRDSVVSAIRERVRLEGAA